MNKKVTFRQFAAVAILLAALGAMPFMSGCAAIDKCELPKYAEAVKAEASDKLKDYSLTLTQTVRTTKPYISFGVEVKKDTAPIPAATLPATAKRYKRRPQSAKLGGMRFNPLSLNHWRGIGGFAAMPNAPPLFNAEQIQGFLRHILTLAGGYFVSRGWLADDGGGTVEVLAGAVAAILGVAFSIVSNRNKKLAPEFRSDAPEQDAPNH